MSQEEIDCNTDAIETDDPNGTKISLRFPHNFPDETIENTLKIAFDFVLNSDLFEYILRTKTAIGIVDTLFDNKVLFNFSMQVNNNSLEISPGYLNNREILTSLYGTTNCYDINTYDIFIKQTEHLDTAAKKVARKTTLIDGTFTNLSIGKTNPLNVRLYICSTSKTHLNEYTKKFDISHNEETISAENGLWLSINGLPTGICLDTFDHPSYLPFTVIADVMDNSIRNELDSGRKGITQYRALQIVDKVKSILKEKNFILYREYVISSDNRLVSTDENPKDILQKKLLQKQKFDIPLKNRYLPPTCEQEVITLFIELISKDIILGYSPQVISSFDIYDCLCQYQCDFSNAFIDNSKIFALSECQQNGNTNINRYIIIEFKHKLRQIFSDVKNIKKNLQDIDIIVCWDVEFEKSSEFVQSNGVVIKEVDRTSNIYYGVTHELIGLGQNTKYLPIIELKTLVNSVYNLNL